jgi:O-antigen/teichoic acid export membrane protein
LSIRINTFWRTLEASGNEAISFLVFSILARLLRPEIFGEMLLANSIIVIMQALLQHGLCEAIIQRRDIEDSHIRVAATANFALAIAMIAIGALLAWPLAKLLGRPEFPLLFCSLLPTLLLRALSMNMLATLRRGLAFRTIALRTILGVLTGGALAIYLARISSSPTALIAQQWAVEIAAFAYMSFASGRQPWRFGFDLQALKSLLHVALPVMGAQMFTNSARRLDSLLLGIFVTDHDLGIYFLASRLVLAVQQVTQNSLNDVMLTFLSRLPSRQGEFAAGLLKALPIVLVVSCLGLGALAIAGPSVIDLLFGSAWAEAHKPIQTMAVLAVSNALISFCGIALIADGHSRSYSSLTIFLCILQLLTIGVAARWGIQAVIYCNGFALLVGALASLYVTHSECRISLVRLARAALWPVALSGCCLLVAGSLAQNERPLGQLIAAAAFGAAMIAIALAALRPRQLRFLRS